MDPIPFYVVKDSWDYVAIAATALGAIGSAFAAGVALWLGVVRHRPRAEGKVRISSERGIATDFLDFPPREIVVKFDLTNLGSRSFTVTAISWHRDGCNAYEPQVVDKAFGQDLPSPVFPLAPASWGAPMRDLESSCLVNVANNLLMPNWRRNLSRLYVRFHTENGYSVRAEPTDTVRRMLTTICQGSKKTENARAD